MTRYKDMAFFHFLVVDMTFDIDPGCDFDSQK